MSSTSLAAVLARTPTVRRASELAGRAIPTVLPVLPEVAGLLPDAGLRRGSTVTVRGSTVLLLALLAAATQRGWAAIVGMPEVGVLAAAELGVVVDRLALVPSPRSQAPEVISALLDGVGLVAVVADRVLPVGQAGVTLARRLSARARNRGTVLMPVGDWPAADLQLRCTATRWEGIGTGHGYLTGCEIDVVVHGRGGAVRPILTTLRLPTAPAPAPADRPHPREPVEPPPSTMPRRARQEWSPRQAEVG